MRNDALVASHQWTYATVSAAMALPVLVWPWLWMSQEGFEAGIPFPMLWMIAASSLLMSAVTADSMLAYRQRTSSMLATSIWVIGMGVWVSTALRMPSAPWLVALGFSLHALRSGWRLWFGRNDWWLWPAWVRDAGLATGIFLWLIALAHA